MEKTRTGKNRLNPNGMIKENTKTVMMKRAKHSYCIRVSNGIVENILHIKLCLSDICVQPHSFSKRFFPASYIKKVRKEHNLN